MTNKIQLLEQQSAAAEKEIENLKKQINSLIAAVNSNTSNSTNDDTTGESDNLKKENEKLKMQINVLKRTLTNRRLNRTIMATDFDTKKHMISIHDSLYCLFEKAIQDAYPDLPDAQIIITSSGKFSDYQCNSAMPISKLLSKIGKKENPLTVANNIVSKIPSSPLIEKLQVAGAGFVNIFLKRDFVHSILTNVLKIGHVLPPPVTKRRIVVDMSSPNVAKEMHVGHLRSTVIGESISRLLEYLGHDVLRLNHIGDWGTQFGMLVAHLQDKYPNYLSESPPISDLQSFYKESKVRFDNDEEFKKRAYACVVKLQAFEPSIIQGWKLICDVSREAFENIYKRLDVTIVERGESFYQNLMEDLVKELEEKNLLEEDEGRKIMWGENRDGIPLTIVKTDGGFTYDTSDLTSLKHRIEVEKAEWVIYVVDGGQSVHFASLESCAKRAKILTSRHRFDHVPFGVVLGEDKKKFKTRSGDTVRLSDLLDEGLRRAEQKLKEKERHKVLSKEEFDAAKEAVAYGCIKYSDLSHNRNNEYIFSFDKMLDDKGNTAVYLLYSLTRIRSIARTANFTQDQLKSAIENSSLSLEHEKEWKLAKVLVKFPDIIFKITKDLCLHTLCEFCYEISCAFTEFYDSCYCVEKK